MSTSELVTYQRERAALIVEDRSLRRDRLVRPSPLELQADQAVRNIRAEEASSIWQQGNDSIPHPFPGMEFLTGVYEVFTHLPHTNIVFFFCCVKVGT